MIFGVNLVSVDTMHIVYEEQFRSSLKSIVDYIASDKVSAAEAFKRNLKNQFDLIRDNPHMHRVSRYRDNNAYRDMIYMGYTTVYKIEDGVIRVLDIFKWVDR